MTESNINLINLQELSIILTAEITHETQIKGDHIYKDIWSPKLGEHLEVYCKPENTADKSAVCVKTGNGAIVGHLKYFFYYLRSHPEAKCTAKITDNLGYCKGLKVPCSLHMTGLNKFVSVLTRQMDLSKET